MNPTLFDLVCLWLIDNRPGDWKKINAGVFQLNDDPIFESFYVYDDRVVCCNDRVLIAADPEFFDNLIVEIERLKHNNLRFVKQLLGFPGNSFLATGYIYAPYIPLQL